MGKLKSGAAHGKKLKQGFANLDREKALKSAAEAIQMLRALSVYATCGAAWRCGLGYALECLEEQLNEILLFSSSNRLPEELFLGNGAVPVAADLGQARKDAAVAVKVFRKILRDAASDLSVDEFQCHGLDQALDHVEVQLNALLPPPGSPQKAKLPFDDDEDDGLVATDLDSAGEIAQPGGERSL
jgi:hypothetical protein